MTAERTKQQEQPYVLVVDDAVANLVAMRAVLQPLEVQIVEASSGREALDRAKERTFAVALIDVQMPRMDGFELARRLREMPESKELPIIFVSAIHRDERYIHNGYAAGAADYLTKPLDLDVLRARVRAFVDLFRQRERLRLSQVQERTRERDEALAQLGVLLERERAARHDAEIASAAKDEFIAVASHELRQPLTAILGWVSVARKTPPGPELDRALGIIEKNARTQKRLVDDLLEMSRSMTGKLELKLGDTSVDETITAAVASLALVAEQKGVNIEVDAPPAIIFADSHRVKQIVTNLVSNAIRFTPEGGSVFVTERRAGDRIRISVKDTGAGIAPEFLPLIFEPYSQANSSSARSHGGFGLGLAIVKQLVTAHGGEIRVESPGVGTGTTFIVELPIVARAQESELGVH